MMEILPRPDWQTRIVDRWADLGMRYTSPDVPCSKGEIDEFLALDEQVRRITLHELQSA